MDVTTADQQEIRAIIQHQLQAFQQDQAEVAFSFASPNIRARFGTPANFLAMVKQAYPVVYRPRSVMFETLVLMQGIPTQEVLLLDANGVVVRALYLMEKQLNGIWKINGCFLVTAQEEPS